MRKLILIAHTSLDGFVAGPKGELNGFNANEENLQFVCSLTEDADAALFGRISYQLLNNSWPAVANRAGATKAEIAYSNWYNRAEKIVVSTTLKNENLSNTTIIRDNVIPEIKKIKESPGKNILIFGSPAISQILMQANLMDIYWIFVNPAIFGKGIPLYTELSHAIKLQLLAIKQFSNGEIALEYSNDSNQEFFLN